jgi:hypothetical protein
MKLEQWKKKIIELLEDGINKSLEDILFPDVLLKAIPVNTQLLLIKARGFAPGTIREWKGHKYKKLSSGKWMRTYEGTGSRGEQQAIRNVIKKIQSAKSMSELSDIIKSNMERFKGPEGKTLPIVKEFMQVARGTDAGRRVDKAKGQYYTNKELESLGVAYGSEEEYERSWREACEQLYKVPADARRRDLRILQGQNVSEIGQKGKQYRVIQAINITGQKITSPQDMVGCLQHFRNPRIELFHYVYTDDKGVIKAHRAGTSGLPSISSIKYKDSMEEQLEDVKKTLKEVGATKVWIAHNHPSGNPAASKEDRAVSNGHYEELGNNYAGHIIIDHDKYNYIKPKYIYDIEDTNEDNIMEHNLSLEKYKSYSNDEPIRDSGTVAKLFRNVLDTDNVSAVAVVNTNYDIISWTYTDGKAGIDKYKKLLNVAGGTGLFFITTDKSKWEAAGKMSKDNRYTKDDIFLDVIYSKGGRICRFYSWGFRLAKKYNISCGEKGLHRS